MPIYEFYCRACHTIFNFLSRRVNTEKIPACPRCGAALAKQLSSFSTIGKARESGDDEMFAGLDEAKLESAFGEIMQEAERLNEDDPRQMAQLMRRLSAKTGLSLGDGMEEALTRLEAGEDPEAIEQELGAALEGDELFVAGRRKGQAGSAQAPPAYDDELYEM